MSTDTASSHIAPLDIKQRIWVRGSVAVIVQVFPTTLTWELTNNSTSSPNIEIPFATSCSLYFSSSISIVDARSPQCASALTPGAKNNPTKNTTINFRPINAPSCPTFSLGQALS